MLPIPKKLLEPGVRDMVRISDARMSGTAYGTCVLHVAPESFVGGPLALVQTGDLITLDVSARRLDLLRRRKTSSPRAVRPGCPESVPPRAATSSCSPTHVTQANEGCDFDFLARRRRRPGARDPLMDGPWDVVIVGAGILGLATARELLAPRPGHARCSCSSASRTIAAHQTGHNSGVIHAGIYYAPGSLKAQLCVEGARRAVRLLRRARDRVRALRQADRRAGRVRAPRAGRARAPRASRTASRACAGVGADELARDRAARDRRRRPALARRRESSTSPPSRGRWPPRSRPSGATIQTGVDGRASTRPTARSVVHTSEGVDPRRAGRRLRGRSGPTASPRPPASPTTRGSSRSAAAT